jgi:hypothetical protein
VKASHQGTGEQCRCHPSRWRAGRVSRMLERSEGTMRGTIRSVAEAPLPIPCVQCDLSHVTIAVDVRPHAILHAGGERRRPSRGAHLGLRRAATVVVPPNANGTQEANGRGGVRCVPHAAVTCSRKDPHGTTHSARRLCHNIWPAAEEAGYSSTTRDSLVDATRCGLPRRHFAVPRNDSFPSRKPPCRSSRTV